MQPNLDTLDDATRVDTASSGLLGRDDDLRRLAGMLHSNRVVALDGAPGVGKSALARALIRALNRPRALCDLATVTTLEGTFRAMLTALSGAPPPNETEASLRQRLTSAIEHAVGRIVLLDDADRVPNLSQTLDEMASWSDGVSFIVTTRRQLSAPSAGGYTLQGLSTADGRALFIDRAQRVRADFDVEDRGVGAIDELVELLDGIPLALELAATRVKVMSPPDIVELVRDSSGALRDRGAASTRHSSMQGALQWSWEMLGADEQQCLMACSTFRGAFPLAAAQAVLAGTKNAVVTAAELVEDLIESSLLESVYADGAVLFRMLNCVRDFAREQLSVSATKPAIEARKKTFLVEHTERLAREMSSSEGPRALSLLDELVGDVIDTVDDALRTGEMESAARLLAALRFNILFRGPFEQFASRIELCLDQPSEFAPEVHATLVVTLAEIETIRGERVEAQSRVEAAIAGLNRADHPREWLMLIRLLAISTAASQPAVAAELLEDGIETARAAGDLFMEARLLERLGFARTQLNDVDAAWLAFSDATDIFRSLGSQLFVGESLSGLGYVELRRGRLELATGHFREVVELYRQTQSVRLLGAARFNLAVACHEGTELDEARSQLTQAVETWRQAGFRAPLPAGLLRLGLTLIECGDLQAARSALTEAMQLAQTMGDHHNAAIAFIERAALDFSEGRPVDDVRVERMTAGIIVGADPAAFGSAVTLCAALAICAGRPALPWVNRVEELLSLFAQGDFHARTVVRDLRDLARSWHLAQQALAARESAAANQFATRAFEMISRVPASSTREAWRRAKNPFVRLWSERLFTVASELPGFAPAGQHFRDVLIVHRSGDWYQLGGQKAVDLTTRRPLRLIAAHLAQVAETDPGRGIDVDEIAAAGWPGETLNLSTRRNRVYTAIRFLREMDLEDILVTGDDGYGFAPDVALRITDEPLPV